VRLCPPYGAGAAQAMPHAVFARSSCDEAIHSFLAAWIASQGLAMTTFAEHIV
jgi:hypothetical protein